MSLYLAAGLASRSRESESWESRFFLGVRVRVGVEKLCLPESRVGVEQKKMESELESN